MKNVDLNIPNETKHKLYLSEHFYTHGRKRKHILRMCAYVHAINIHCIIYIYVLVHLHLIKSVQLNERSSLIFFGARHVLFSHIFFRRCCRCCSFVCLCAFSFLLLSQLLHFALLLLLMRYLLLLLLFLMCVHSACV